MPTYFFTGRYWAFCEKCNAGRTHAIGYDIRVQGKQLPVKMCATCGHVTERKPKEYKRD